MKKSGLLILLLSSLLALASCDFLGGLLGPTAPDADTVEAIEGCVQDLHQALFDQSRVDVAVEESVSDDGTHFAEYTLSDDCGLAMYTRIRKGARLTLTDNAHDGTEAQSFGFSYEDVITDDVYLSLSGEIVKSDGAFESCIVKYGGRLYDMLPYAADLWYAEAAE